MEWHTNGNLWCKQVISTIVEKANLPKINPHGLRYTHAIMMLESGNDRKIVSDRLGHSSLNTLESYLKD